MNIYADQIVDLYKNPLNLGKIEEPSCTYKAHNPLCGDEITVDIVIDQGVVSGIKHRGVGCAISQASISLLTEEIKGKSVEEVMILKAENVLSLLGIDLGPVRLKCALLSLEAIHQALSEYLNQQQM